MKLIIRFAVLILAILTLTHVVSSRGLSPNDSTQRAIADAAIICIGMSIGLMAYERHRRR